MENEKGEIVDLYVFLFSVCFSSAFGLAGWNLWCSKYHQVDASRRKAKQKGNMANNLLSAMKYSYVPRKCSATNRIIKANDHGSVQISIGKVDENGRYTGENETYALCGFIRGRGESDDSFNRLTQRDGYLKNVWSANRTR